MTANALDSSNRLYLVCDSYMDAIEYRYAKDLCPFTTRWVSHASVLKGIDRPRVIVIGAAVNVGADIVEALARHNAQVTYDTLEPQGPIAPPSTPSHGHG